ncbi:YkvA family protein [Microbacterium sp. NPDC056044]|uniref:YkvA family protein n=1 Tax=Microbacterium sp. NPDC056044 TaxID=3345690 RepID=UPI0035D5912B
MPGWALIVLSVVGGLVVVWLVLLLILWLQQRRAGRNVDWRQIMRLVADVVVLLKRLVADPEVPRGTRWWLGGLLVYLLLPIDLVPDFLPVLGYADDAIIVAIALRYAIRTAGRSAIERHWPGTPEGLASLLSLVGAR